MTLQFPNVSRSFDAARDCVRFSGYDHTREVAFFIAGDAIRGFEGGLLPDAESLLSAFDRNRDRICQAAGKAYGRRDQGAYTLTASDF
ncbi:MAG: hypothetical protein RJA94_2019 [Pseudomonadota bacterium]|jgi:hypothetical protein